MIVSLLEAKRLGFIYYFTGEPCRYGHIAERRVSNRSCIVCLRKRNAAWMRKDKKENPEKYKLRARKFNKVWRKNNIEKNKKRHSKYYNDNKEKYYINQISWRERNREKVNSYAKVRYYTDLGKLRKLCADTSVRLSLGSFKHSRLSLLDYNAKDFISKMESTLPEGLTFKEARINKYHIDHIIPLSFISLNITNKILAFKISMDLENLRMISAKENISKHSKIDVEDIQLETLKYLNTKYNTEMQRDI